MSENQNIIDFIHANFSTSYHDLASEVDKIFNNLTKEECYIPYVYNSLFIINGVSNNIKGTLTFAYLIPNLFRKCFTEPNVHIPNICPTFIFNSRVTNYFPLLLEENLIKSFLYFNFTSDYTVMSDPQRLLHMLGAIDRLRLIKSNTTYGSFTTSAEIFNNLYSSDSLLVQLLQFNHYINYSTSAHNDEKTIANYIIPWNYVDYCICYTGYLNDTYIISNDNSTINEDLGYNLNNIRYSSVNTILSNFSINTNNVITIAPSNSIFRVINYAVQVYEDVLMQIQYYMGNINYCKKDYMLKSNIPYLLELYKNYYNNSLYVGNKSIPVATIKDISANTISIVTYLDNFRKVFLKNQPYNGYTYTQYNEVVISDIEGVDLFWTSSYSSYSFWYININNPSAIELFNSSSSQTASSTAQYIKLYFIPGTYNTSGSSSYTYQIYLNSGVLSTTDKTAYTYFFYNSDGVLTAKYYIFLLYPSSGSSKAQGVALKYFTYLG
jgi:hypothetical protein